MLGKIILLKPKRPFPYPFLPLNFGLLRSNKSGISNLLVNLYYKFTEEEKEVSIILIYNQTIT